jgi:hypothetical protein
MIRATFTQFDEMERLIRADPGDAHLIPIVNGILHYRMGFLRLLAGQFSTDVRHA